MGGSGNYLRFAGCLIDSISRCGDSATNGFFGAYTNTGFYNYLVGYSNNFQVADVKFVDPDGLDKKTHNDYMLEDSSPGFGTASVEYNDINRIVYVDINRNNSYDSGLDVIVAIKRGSSYVHGSNEYYYPIDLNGNPFIRWQDDNPVMNIGAFTPPRPPTGTIIKLR